MTSLTSQVISSLHKQNFDLKLELYHRRERQTALEERVEALEAEKTKFDELNDKFVQELEKRDKAVEEAVAMIVMLEAKIDQFAKERSMVHQIEAEGHYTNVDAYQMTPKSNVPEFLFEDDVRSLARMPSFLSERSEYTENLRSVYLGVKGSMISLPQVVEGSGDTDTPAERMASPTMSVLSESSFVSVYGHKSHPEVDEPLSLDGVDSLPGKASTIKRPKTSLARPAQPQNRSARSNSTSYPNGRPFQSMANVVDGSPLQRIERMERSYPKKEERPQSREKDAAAFSGRNAKPSNHRRTRDEKREALRKVLTDSAGGVRLHDHALPPTPDTISTSTLRRFQNSDDTLSKEQEIRNRRSTSALSDLSALDEKAAEPPAGVSLEPETVKPKAREIAFFENRPPIQRPRSAGETTVSHRGHNDWDSDSDDSDARSLESSLDIWMRESAKPDRTGRGSPDLFSFPTNSSRGWAMDAMFGPGSSTYGSAVLDPERLIEMFPPSTQQGLLPANVPPPAPHRRSSLHAQTGANSNTKETPKAQKTSKRSRGRRNSDDPQIAQKTPVQQPQTAPGSDHKKNHYPPIVGQPNGRNPLTKLFRRSLGAGSNVSAESTPATVIEPTFADIPRSNTTIGVPSWVSRAAAEDDRESATPPPIMRKSHQGRGAPMDLEMPLATQDLATPTTATYADTGMEETNSPRTVSATGHRRKWLPGFGRNNVKKST